ncbi:MAG: hypothetical protein ORO03_08605 [Alphaproteobacteria bacterium]|nr:hypothetical protein [Alphaproteobacteria bacterium]
MTRDNRACLCCRCSFIADRAGAQPCRQRIAVDGAGSLAVARPRNLLRSNPLDQFNGGGIDH